MWTRFTAWLKTEPTALVQAAQAVLGALVAFGVVGFTDAQTGAVLAAVSAASGLLLALAVRPFNWAVLAGLLQAAVVLAAEFWTGLDDAQVAAVYTVVSGLGVLLRQKVTPETKLQPIAS